MKTLLSLFLLTQVKSELAETLFDGETRDKVVDSMILQEGKGGIKLNQIPRPSTKAFDYMIMFWFKAFDLQSSSAQFLFQSPQDISITFTQNQEIAVQSSGDQDSLSFSIDALQANRWTHLACAGSASNENSKTYLLLSYSNEIFDYKSGRFRQLRLENNAVMLGNSYQPGSNGLKGKIREFILANTFHEQAQVKQIRNQVFAWDIRILAYYRFNSQSLEEQFLKSELTAELVQAEADQVPQFNTEYGINDICYQAHTYLQLPLFSSDRQIQKKTLDLRFNREQTGYHYTLSTWIYMQQGTAIVSNSWAAKNTALFHLEEVFYCHMSGLHYLKCFIEAVKDYQGYATNAVTVPLNEWANVQFKFSHYSKGYDLRVYNQLRQLQSRQAVRRSFYAQKPEGSLYLFRNFRGRVRDFALYEADIDLPMMTALGTGNISEHQRSSLLAYFNLDMSNFFKRQDAVESDPYEYVQMGYSRQTINLYLNVPVDGWQFEYIEWNDELTFDDPTIQGTFENDQSLFDGVACDDGNYMPRTGETLETAIQYQMELENDLTQLSVEFWFMKEQVQETQSFLFQIHQNSNSKDHFAIFQANSRLITCQPFGQEGKILEFKDLDFESKGEWQHVSCSYSEDIDITGVYFDYSNKHHYTYNINLEPGEVTTLPAGSYTVTLGNNFRKTLPSITTYFKDIRIWSSIRTYDQIKYSRRIQLTKPYSQFLLSYVKFTSGTPLHYDEVSENQASLYDTVRKNPREFDPESQFQVCPVMTYVSEFTQKCLQSPYKEAQIYVFFDDSKKMTVSSSFSDFRAKNIQDNLQYSWDILNQESIQPFFQSSKTKDVTIDTINNQNYLDGQEIEIEFKSTNTLTLFQETKVKKIVPTSCRYLEDTENLSSIVEKELSFGRGLYNLEFIFDIKGDQTQCLDTFPTLAKIDIAFYPTDLYLEAGLTLDQVARVETIQVSSGEGEDLKIEEKWKITITKEVQKLLKIDQNFSVVCTAKWNALSQVSELVSEQSVGYLLKFVYAVDTKVEYGNSVMLIDENLILDGSDTKIIAHDNVSQEQEGIQYQWVCHENFLSICQVEESNTLEISFSQFQELTKNDFDTQYVFEFFAWHSSDPEREHQDNKVISITWLDIEYPDFEITTHEQTIVTTEDTLFEALLLNYAPSNPVIETEWTIEPQIQEESLFLSPDSSLFTIQANSLLKTQSYILTCTIKNTLSSKAVTTKVFEFTTTSEPIEGTVLITPTQGIRFDTMFTFRVQNYRTLDDSDVFFRVFQEIENEENEEILVEITDHAYKQGEVFQSQLPTLTQVIFKISDANGEFTLVPQLLAVREGSEEPDFDADIIKVASLSIEEIYPAITKIIYAFEEYDSITPAFLSRQSNREQIASFLQDKTSQLRVGQVSDFAQIVVEQSVLTLPLLIEDDVYLSDKIIGDAIDIVTSVQIPQDLFQEFLQEEEFRQAFATSLSHLISFLQAKLERLVATGGRLLATTYRTETQGQIQGIIDELLRQKEQFMDSQCLIQEETDQKWQTKTAAFDSSIQKFLATDTTVTRSFVSQEEKGIITLPILRIIQDAEEYFQEQDRTLASLCAQASFLMFDPLGGEIVENQQVLHELIVQVAYDFRSEELEFDSLFSEELISNTFQTEDTLTQAEADGGLQLYFHYDFKNTRMSQFHKNQTMCMWHKEEFDNGVFITAFWTPEDCNTYYLYDDNMIKCLCKSIRTGSFYTIVYDSTRIEVDPVDDTIREDPILYYEQDEKNIFILLSLIFFIVFGSCCACWLDHKDYEEVQDKKDQKLNDFVQKLSGLIMRPYQVLVYKKKLINYFRYREESDLTFGHLFKLLFYHSHHFFEIFFTFDARHHRFIRVTTYLFQMSFTTLIIVIKFAEFPRSDSDRISEWEKNSTEQDKYEDAIDMVDIGQIIGYSILFGFLMLPIPHFILNFACKAQFSKESAIFSPNQAQRQLSAKETHEETDLDVDLEQDRQPTRMRMSYNKKEVKGPPEEEPLYMTDKCIPMKIIFIIFTWIFTTFVCAYIREKSPSLSRAQNSVLFTVWILSVIGSLFLHNLLKVLVTAYFVQTVVEGQQEKGNKSFKIWFLDWFFVGYEAKQIVMLFHIVNEVKLMEKAGKDRASHKDIGDGNDKKQKSDIDVTDLDGPSQSSGEKKKKKESHKQKDSELEDLQIESSDRQLKDGKKNKSKKKNRREYD